MFSASGSRRVQAVRPAAQAFATFGRGRTATRVTVGGRKQLGERSGGWSKASDWKAAAQRYMHAIEGRDLEIAKALSSLASVDDAAKLPRSRRTEDVARDVARGHGRAR